ncbi:hypothetical protein COLO4_32652 [Corchorus olitorius]|uniref:Uncharacterized protein n=1 Tax=Corchorus olitorius TaxID=93759 RepID=A0A1R3GYM2_9ROSI|nr:hypothetical protein COLO4_32652 [Corchorus olitorius]
MEGPCIDTAVHHSSEGRAVDLSRLTNPDQIGAMPPQVTFCGRGTQIVRTKCRRGRFSSIRRGLGLGALGRLGPA